MVLRCASQSVGGPILLPYTSSTILGLKHPKNKNHSVKDNEKNGNWKREIALVQIFILYKNKKKKLIYLMNFESAFRVTNAKNVTHSNGQYGTYVQHKCFFRRLDLFSKHDDVH